MGDAVEAYDPTDGTTSVQTVQHVFLDHDTDLLAVTLRPVSQGSAAPEPRTTTRARTTTGSSAPDEVVHTTASHPWLTADRGWARAGTLHLGERVVRADGSAAVVVGLAVVPGTAAMWDLTVSQVHTFIVGSGHYVVHNCGGSSSWGRPSSLNDHFQRHGGDFGATSPDNYAQQASDFLKNAQMQGLPTKIDPSDGTIRVYDPATNTFGAYNADGTTRTFFKPSSPSYWIRQPGSAPVLF